MTKFHATLKALIVVCFTLALAAVAQGQATRTWVSGVGDDVNPCSRTAPCKTFAGAISKTAKDGEINAIDPGGFGAVTITKSITIDGNGTHASILASGTTGVIVNITDPADVRKTVRLRNISINGAATGVHGVRFLAGSKLFIENCQIFGFQSAATSRGIIVALAASGAQVHVQNTEIANCASGIDISTTVPNVSFMIDNVRVGGMTDGIILGGGANGAIRDTTISLNSGVGVKITAGTANVGLERDYISQNGTGVQPIAGSTTVFSNTSIFGNGTGIANTGGTLTSHGNNQFTLNGAGATPTIIGQQ